MQWALHSTPLLCDGEAIPFASGTIMDDSAHICLSQHAHLVKEAVNNIHARWNVQRNLQKDAEEGTPSHIFSWYGVEINLRTGILSIPTKKRSKFLLRVYEVLDADEVHISLIEKLHGMLSWAATIIVPGRSFLFHIRKLLANRKPLIRLNEDVIFELHFWKEVLSSRSSGFSASIYDKPTIFISTDAAPSRGIGAITYAAGTLHIYAHSFNQLLTTTEEFLHKVGALEFFAILAAVMTFQEMIAGKHIVILTDSASSMHTINSRTARTDGWTAILLKELMLFLARAGASISAKHIPGEHNCIADTLSRQGAQAARKIMHDNGVKEEIKCYPTNQQALDILQLLPIGKQS
jgi:ribonuclease HI